ncbi:membrane protein [Salinibacter sp. 10B]|uniref:glycosyltransferase family 117 protein n=1 Tax=Salinibacter sp. 10B TaxID=1923971 RepID=UPI000CF3990F|nr:DUF2723 domain-containing protein [Salinibacter sp. 10B]PQJ33877.1 membrane protein [Salinibacter sp. 10B]
MNRKWIDRLTAGAVFLWALILYVSTMAPTVSFWDPGERIASAFKLQVMHPPGAPFYLLLGRLFSMLAPSEETVALAVNTISVLASAGTVMLAHLIIVRLVRRWQGDLEDVTTGQYVIALVSGVIGALTYAATDSFWFNAGIAEVYALSTFFTALVVWLVLRWSSAARREEEMLKGQGSHLFQLDANRYLVLIAALFGMAIGVHLLSLLAFFFVALIVFFTEFEKDSWTQQQLWGRLVLAGLASSAIFLAIYPGIVKGLPKVFDATGAPFISAIGIIGLVTYGVYATHKRRMPRANLALLCLAVILIGYGSYALVFVRSATEPSIDMNDPDNIERFIDYMEREQYGATPLLSGVSYNDQSGRVPRDGESKLFPRRHSPNSQHWSVYDRYDSDLGFFLDYQVGYMYVRYFLWNFAGRASDVQGATWMTGIPMLDQHVNNTQLKQTPSQKEARNMYFALPLLLGLFGAFYHFNRDWRRAFSVFVLFFVTGIGIIIYLNQTPMQPRERDYSYVGSFLAFSLWIGIGAGGLLQMVYESIKDTMSSMAQLGPLLGAGLLVFLTVPGWMTVENYGDHDRSENYVARDYAHNMLSSVAEDGIVFTNGDNDTYPLWYMQEVEGFRTDVRVVNLSLLNTPWYIRQLKQHDTYESEALPISMSNDQIQDIRPRRWKPRQVTLPVQTQALSSRFSEYMPDASNDTTMLESPMTWRLKGRSFGQKQRLLQAADLAVYNMLRTNAQNQWKRPIYFAVTVARSGQLNLSNYFQLEGQAYRVFPIKHKQPLGRVIPGLTDDRMSEFRFTNLADSSAYYNENARRMVDGYRLHFSHTSERLAKQGHTERSRQLMTNFTEEVPFSTIPGDVNTLMFTARAFRAIGDTEKLAGVLQEAQPVVFNELQTASSQRQFSQALFYAGRVRKAFVQADNQEALNTFDEKLDAQLAKAPYSVPARIRRAYGLSSDTSGGGPQGMPMGVPGGGPGASSPTPAPSGNAPSGNAPSGN